MKTAKGEPVRLLIKLRRLWLVLMLMGGAFGCSAALADDPKPSFVFVEGAAETFSPNRSNAFSIDILLKNSGGKDGQASLTLLSDKDKRCDQAKGVDPKAKIGVSANAVTIKHLEITDVQLPATCFLQLVTEGEGGNSSLKQIKFNQQYVTSAVLRPLWTCFWISLVVAGLAWIFACLTKPVSPIFMLGSPSWDFAKSWTSNATLVGGIVTAALSLSALPELTKYASKSGYSALALLLSLVVAVAPFIFIALRSGTVQKDAATKQDVVVYQG